jgi:hypothetical protein
LPWSLTDPADVSWRDRCKKHDTGILACKTWRLWALQFPHKLGLGHLLRSEDSGICEDALPDYRCLAGRREGTVITHMR